jgi:hypothetical protein
MGLRICARAPQAPPAQPTARYLWRGVSPDLPAANQAWILCSLRRSPAELTPKGDVAGGEGLGGGAGGGLGEGRNAAGEVTGHAEGAGSSGGRRQGAARRRVNRRGGRGVPA